MKLEDQVVSLKYAKKMKELGFKQKSLFYHSIFKGEKKYHLNYGNKSILHRNKWVDIEKAISAYTVAELGEMLPEGQISSSKIYLTNCPSAGDIKWLVRYIKKEIEEETCDKTEADARAKMLIYLKENNLI